MPIKCPGGGKPRYRWKDNVRLAFCGNTVVETKKKGGEAKLKQAVIKKLRRRKKK